MIGWYRAGKQITTNHQLAFLKLGDPGDRGVWSYFNLLFVSSRVRIANRFLKPLSLHIKL